MATNNKCHNHQCSTANGSHANGSSLAEEQPTTVLATARAPQQVVNGDLVLSSIAVSEVGGAGHNIHRGAGVEQTEGAIGAAHSQCAVWRDRQTDRQTTDRQTYFATIKINVVT